MSNSATTQAVDDFLQSGVPPLGPEFDCPYLRGRKAQFRCLVADDLHPEIYHAMMDRGFRRTNESVLLQLEGVRPFGEWSLYPSSKCDNGFDI